MLFRIMSEIKEKPTYMDNDSPKPEESNPRQINLNTQIYKRISGSNSCRFYCPDYWSDDYLVGRWRSI